MRKAYVPPTYSQQADASRISVQNQAKEYAAWLLKNNRHSCAVYPLRKTATATSNKFRQALLLFHDGHLRFKEVNPDDFLGKWS